MERQGSSVALITFSRSQDAEAALVYDECELAGEWTPPASGMHGGQLTVVGFTAQCTSLFAILNCSTVDQRACCGTVQRGKRCFRSAMNPVTAALLPCCPECCHGAVARFACLLACMPLTPLPLARTRCNHRLLDCLRPRRGGARQRWRQRGQGSTLKCPAYSQPRALKRCGGAGALALASSACRGDRAERRAGECAL